MTEGIRLTESSELQSKKKEEVTPLGLEPRAHTLKVYCSTS